MQKDQRKRSSPGHSTFFKQMNVCWSLLLLVRCRSVECYEPVVMTFVCHPCCILVTTHLFLERLHSCSRALFSCRSLLLLSVCVCVLWVHVPVYVFFPFEKNNYKLYGLSLWAWLSGPSPWLHGCNRLITCLILVMSPRWQLFPGLWKQTYLSWPGPGLEDLSVAIAALGFSPFSCLSYLF